MIQSCSFVTDIIALEVLELIWLSYLGLFRFELKHFDPFLVLDEFSGGQLCFLLT